MEIFYTEHQVCLLPCAHCTAGLCIVCALMSSELLNAIDQQNPQRSDNITDFVIVLKRFYMYNVSM